MIDLSFIGQRLAPQIFALSSVTSLFLRPSLLKNAPFRPSGPSAMILYPLAKPFFKFASSLCKPALRHFEFAARQTRFASRYCKFTSSQIPFTSSQCKSAMRQIKFAMSQCKFTLRHCRKAEYGTKNDISLSLSIS